jgi:hypothetical protein
MKYIKLFGIMFLITLSLKTLGVSAIAKAPMVYIDKNVGTSVTFSALSEKYTSEAQIVDIVKTAWNRDVKFGVFTNTGTSAPFVWRIGDTGDTLTFNSSQERLTTEFLQQKIKMGMQLVWPWPSTNVKAKWYPDGH